MSTLGIHTHLSVQVRHMVGGNTSAHTTNTLHVSDSNTRCFQMDSQLVMKSTVAQLHITMVRGNFLCRESETTRFSQR